MNTKSTLTKYLLSSIIILKNPRGKGKGESRRGGGEGQLIPDVLHSTLPRQVGGKVGILGGAIYISISICLMMSLLSVTKVPQ